MIFKNRKQKDEERSYSIYDLMNQFILSNYWNESDPIKISYLDSLENESVWTCTRVISETISNFPLKVYEKKNNGQRIQRPDHFLNSLFSDPTDDIDGKNYKQLLLQHALIKGNHHSYIVRNKSGKPKNLIPLDPDNMKVYRDKQGFKYFQYNGKLYDKSEIFHYMGFTANGLNGISPVDLFKASIVEGIDADRFLGKFFKRGNLSRLGYKFPVSEEITPEKIKAIQEQFRKHFLGLENSFMPIIYPDGTELKEIKSYSLKDDDVLELRKQAILKVASIYSVPPHFLNILDNANYSNITALNENFYKITLLPWLVRLEKAIEKQLLPEYEKGRIYVKFDPRSLLRGSDSERAIYYQTMHNQGFMSVNEIRTLEDLDRLGSPEADYHFIPANTIALEKYNLKLFGK